MEVLEECTAYLCNYEVLNILQNIKSNKKQKVQNQLATITYETIRYLEETPCAKQKPEQIQGFLKDCEPFKLKKNEKLSLLNLCPKEPVEIQLTIEDSEERLTEDEVDSLLQVVANHFEPEKQKEEESQEKEAEESCQDE